MPRPSDETLRGPRKLLHSLLEYIGEQAKSFDPRAFRLGQVEGKVFRREMLAGLPSVDFDLKIEGDHVWLGIDRLEADKPPAPPRDLRDLVRIADDPDGPQPAVDESRFLVMLDVFSRYVVGWMVTHRESATLAEQFIHETCAGKASAASSSRFTPTAARP